MMELGYTKEWEGDNSRDVLDFVQAYSRMWCAGKFCKTDNDAALKADHVIVYKRRQRGLFQSCGLQAVFNSSPSGRID